MHHLLETLLDKNTFKTTRSITNRCKNLFLLKPFKRKGAVIIEFAVCIPFLILLFQYITDIIRIGKLSSQVEFVGYSTVNLLQDLPQVTKLEIENNPNHTEADTPYLNASDIRKVFAAAWLHFYPSAQLYYDTKVKIFPVTLLYYIKGEEDGSATCLWGLKITTNNPQASSPSNISIEFFDASNVPTYSTIKWGIQVEPESIHEVFHIPPNHYKIIVESMLTCNAEDYSEIKKALGVSLTLPRHRTDSAGNYFFAHAVLVFTPVIEAFGTGDKQEINPLLQPTRSNDI